MLNGNDVQLFYKLLDSLSNSLRDLAVKYELLVSATTREAGEVDKTNSAIANMAREVSMSFANVTREIEQLEEMASNGRESNSALSMNVNSVMKIVESLSSQMASTLTEIQYARSETTEGKNVILHVDSHMDSFGNQLAALQTMFVEMKLVIAAVEDMKKQLKPFEKLTSLFSKPAAVIVGVYVIFTTIMTILKGCEDYGKLQKRMGEARDAAVQTKTIDPVSE